MVNKKPISLVDTSFLIALSFEKDKNYDIAREAILELTGQIIVPSPILLELFHVRPTTAII